MEFRILGPLEVRDGDRLVPLGSVKERALLAVLLTQAGELVSRDRLIDELWAGEPPSSAVSVLHTYVSHLRGALGAEVLKRRGPGYVLELETHDLDLRRFELLIEQARESAPAQAAELLDEALGLWRGRALADFEYHPFAQAEIARLEELHLMTHERRLQIALDLGHHAEVVGDLEALVSRHPLRERPRGLLMVALYRCGRQAEALEAYQHGRRALVEGLGIEPGRPLQELERAILRHDPSLDLGADAAAAQAHDARENEGAHATVERSILVVPGADASSGELLALAEALARRPLRELIFVRLLSDGEELGNATASLVERRDALLAAGVPARIAAFTSSEPGRDIVLAASEQRSDLVLLQAPPQLLADGVIDDELHVVLGEAPCDVAMVVARGVGSVPVDGPVVVPFTGADHDWAAIEIAAWMSRSLGTSLRLLGTAADESTGRRDASRLLARASLMVQQVVGIVTEPELVEAGDESLIAASEKAGLLVLGLSSRWRAEGLGDIRLAVARDARPTTLLVRRGLRPGGLAPGRSVTRFSWTLGDGLP